MIFLPLIFLYCIKKFHFLINFFHYFFLIFFCVWILRYIFLLINIFHHRSFSESLLSSLSSCFFFINIFHLQLISESLLFSSFLLTFQLSIRQSSVSASIATNSSFLHYEKTPHQLPQLAYKLNSKVAPIKKTKNKENYRTKTWGIHLSPFEGQIPKKKWGPLIKFGRPTA